MKARLELVSNIVVTLAVVVLGGLMARDRLLLPRTNHIAGDLRPGVSLDAPATYDWSKQPATLLVALRPGCRYCESSIPFYQRLAVREREQHLSAHVLAVIASDESQARKYAAAERLGVELVPSADLASLKIQATPTLILVDAAGRVRHAWIGKLTDAEEAEVLQVAGR